MSSLPTSETRRRKWFERKIEPRGARDAPATEGALAEVVGRSLMGVEEGTCPDQETAGVVLAGDDPELARRATLWIG